MRMGIFGYLGSGKTLILVYLLIMDYYLKGIVIYTNLKLVLPTYEEIFTNPDLAPYMQILIANGLTVNDQPDIKPFDFEYFLELALTGEDLPEDNCLVAVDELQRYLDARNHQGFGNRIFSYLIFEARKRGMDIYFTAPKNKYQDDRMRDNMDRAIKCYKYHFIQHIDGLEDTDQCYDEKCLEPHDFVYDILDLHNLIGTEMNIADQQKIKTLYTYYNTRQKITPTVMENTSE